ncbi:MAG: rRNA adenine dimethyltransferase family protein, partial [Gammaproteobacteria bacterium]|nr:rRNA adenine dimethyltransferase family protein [Gammaproteobacteria bacterium]
MTAFTRRRFGQHFLHDPQVIERIVAAVAPQPEQRLLEIGPGRGALTERLLASGCELHAIEIDRDLARELRERFAGQARFVLHEGDALRLDLNRLGAPQAAYLAPSATPPYAVRRWRIVGNLPYNISTPLLFHLLAQRAAIADLHLMLQREVVERMTAPPGGAAYGRLT